MVVSLVTGSSGFIGRNLVKYLKSIGNEVLELDIKNGHDIRDPYAVQPFVSTSDEVYHLAAQSLVSSGESDPFTDLEVNGKGMLTLLKCLERDPKPMVFASTGSVYGLTDSFPHAEDALIQPTSNYGCSKRLAELYLQKWVLMKGLDAKIVRFSSVYGPDRGRYGPVNIFIDLALKGEDLTVYGDGTQTRDLLYIDDAVKALRHVLHNGEPGEIYNAGTGYETSVHTVAEMVSQYTGAKIKYIKGHKFSLFDIKRSYYNTSKIENIGWSAFNDPLIGIRKTLNKMKES